MQSLADAIVWERQMSTSNHLSPRAEHPSCIGHYTPDIFLVDRIMGFEQLAILKDQLAKQAKDNQMAKQVRPFKMYTFKRRPIDAVAVSSLHPGQRLKKQPRQSTR